MCLKDKLELALGFNEIANTDIEKVFNLILDTAVSNGLSQDELPRNILIISDMEFDHGVESCDERLFDSIKIKYEENGYDLPRLVFWNVNSRSGTIPVRENSLGVALVSGFSPNILKMVMGDVLDPYELLLSVLNSPRYSSVYVNEEDND